MDTSKKYSLNKHDMGKIFRGLLIALGGALLTYANGIVINTDFTIHFQDMTVSIAPMVMAIWSVVFNAGIKFFNGEDSDN